MAHITQLYTYPNTIAPTSENEMYRANTRREVKPQTADIAGSVVVGPAIRKANAAAGFIPCASRPLTIGNADMLLA